MITGKNDFSIWTLTPDLNLLKLNRSFQRYITHKIVWFGGVEGHKISSINWFLNKILPELKNQIPNLEFHLFGRNTEMFKDTAKHIFSHGEYHGADMPMKDVALYINPDILGGGIKVKIQSFLNNGVTFISSPFGFEGYNKALIDNDYCYVIEDIRWVEAILGILAKQTSFIDNH